MTAIRKDSDPWSSWTKCEHEPDPNQTPTRIFNLGAIRVWTMCRKCGAPIKISEETKP